MKLGKLREILKDYPDDVEILTPNLDYGISTGSYTSPVITKGTVYKYAEDLFAEYDPEYERKEDTPHTPAILFSVWLPQDESSLLYNYSNRDDK
jgi:hypothetical protein